MLQGMDGRIKSVLVNRSLKFIEISSCRPKKNTACGEEVAKLKEFLKATLRSYSESEAGDKKAAFDYFRFVIFLSRNRSLGIHAARDKFEGDFGWFLSVSSKYNLFKLRLGCLMLSMHQDLAPLYNGLSPFRRVELFNESGAVEPYLKYRRSVADHFILMEILNFA